MVEIALIFCTYAHTALINGSIDILGVLAGVAAAALNAENYFIVFALELAGCAGEISLGESALAEIMLFGFAFPVTLCYVFGVFVFCTDADELINKTLEGVENDTCIKLFVIGITLFVEAGFCIICGIYCRIVYSNDFRCIGDGS